MQFQKFKEPANKIITIVDYHNILLLTVMYVTFQYKSFFHKGIKIPYIFKRKWHRKHLHNITTFSLLLLTSGGHGEIY